MTRSRKLGLALVLAVIAVASLAYAGPAQPCSVCFQECLDEGTACVNGCPPADGACRRKCLVGIRQCEWACASTCY